MKRRILPVIIMLIVTLVIGLIAPSPWSNLLAEASGGANIAPSATVTASTYGAQDTPDKAIDGIKDNNASRWSSKWYATPPAGTPKTPQWLQLEWNAPVSIDNVRLWSGNMTSPGWQLVDFEIQYWDGSGWVTAAAVSDNAKDGKLGQFNDLTFAPVQTQKLRVYVTDGCQYDTVARIFEIEVYESAGPSLETVHIDTAERHQTIEGWGGNVYPQFIPLFAANDPNYMNKMLDELKTTNIRVRSYWYLMEEANDDGDSQTFDWSEFQAGDKGDVHKELLALQMLYNRGVKLTLGSWRFPNWMVGKPPGYNWSGAQMTLPADMDDEYAESMAGYLLYARQQYGVTFDYIAVANEPNGGGVYINGITPARYASLTQKLKQKLEANGYRAEYLAGDTNAATISAAQYAESVLFEDAYANPEGQRLFNTLSYHAYERSVAGLQRYEEAARTYGVKLHVGEQEDQIIVTDKDKWSRAMNNAVAIHDSLTYSRANLLQYFAYSATDSGGLVIYSYSGKTWYPVYDMLKHFYDAAPPGSVMIGAHPDASSVSDLYTVAFEKPDRKLEIVLINAATETRQLKLTGVGSRMFSVRSSGEFTRNSLGQDIAGSAAGEVTVTVAPNSIVSLSEKAVGGTVQALQLSSASSAPLIKGDRVQLSAAASYNNGTESNVTADVQYASSDNAVATVTRYGLVTGLSAGTAAISATFGGRTAVYELTVEAIGVRLLQLSGLSSPVDIGSEQQLAVTALFSDNTSRDVTAYAEFANSSPLIAGVDAAGKVTGLSVGSTVITATYSHLSVAVPVMVQSSNSSTAAESMLTGAGFVSPGEDFVVRYGLKGVTESVYAQDIIVSFDPALLKYVSVQSLREGISIVRAVKQAEGKLQVIVASQGSCCGFTGDGDIIAIAFKAKNIQQTGTANVTVSKVMLGDALGIESEAASASLDILIERVIPGDVNRDGKVSVGDLSVASINLGKGSVDPDWKRLKPADLDGDGVLTPTDLTLLAKLLMN
ncbi:hypothetical protein GC102_07140 [Paenibacillus sp. LMG 31460]|uniref:Dockerin domain-containing protein n=1 Tax=Paenibacillus germinis TaxID=2654979 RepID=A0ABX1Z0R9_9BACL|nr:cohesin domain-containing protein [Paenibacillus germinis]NOU85553.1 hypothetical protein [Paenibacillus germinis]